MASTRAATNSVVYDHLSKAKVDIKVKVDTREIAKAEARAPRACLRAKDHAKVSKAGSLRPRALQSYSYRRRLMAPPLLSPQVPRTSPATSVTKNAITSPNALNGWRFGHPQRINKQDSRLRALA